MKVRTLTVAISLVFLSVVLLTGGCASRSNGPATKTPRNPSAPTTPSAGTDTDTDTTTVLLYFARGEKIGVAGRQVEAPEKPASLAFNAVQALLEGPTAEEQEFGLGTTIPQGSKVNGVEVNGKRATVDLSSQFASGGGSLSMQMRAAQVVFTLTQFPQITEVAFKLDGKPLEALGGEGLIVSPSVSRSDFEGVLPAILVEHPYPGQDVVSPISVSGSANVFEAQFKVEVTDPEGLIITEQKLTATSGTGTRGTFNAQVEFSTQRTGLGAVIFSEPSPKDGKPTNVVEIPVRMK